MNITLLLSDKKKLWNGIIFEIIMIKNLKRYGYIIYIIHILNGSERLLETNMQLEGINFHLLKD